MLEQILLHLCQKPCAKPKSREVMLSDIEVHGGKICNDCFRQDMCDAQCLMLCRSKLNNTQQTGYAGMTLIHIVDGCLDSDLQSKGYTTIIPVFVRKSQPCSHRYLCSHNALTTVKVVLLLVHVH